MAEQTRVGPPYITGRTNAEVPRVMQRSSLFDRITRRFLEDAGMRPAMTVLDVGSGAGNVNFAAAVP